MVDYFGEDEVATWKFEVYNEPDLSNLGCPSVNLTTNASDPGCKYFEMFAACSGAIKNVSTKLQVGGCGNLDIIFVQFFLSLSLSPATPPHTAPCYVVN